MYVREVYMIFILYKFPMNNIVWKEIILVVLIRGPSLAWMHHLWAEPSY